MSPLKYLSVCSGIEAATVAWHPLGWEPVGFSEIDRFPSAVLQHHYPNVSNYGDMNGYQRWPQADADVLVGGTPCQSFSVAGLRAGMADPRGNLALIYLAIADQYRPEWLVWENVPGVLSSNGGRDFGSIIGGMVELGYRPTWRVLDAQYFGVPQRRRRVFVVGHSGSWERAAQVLLEPESLRRNPPPSREAEQGITHSLRARTPGCGGANEIGNDGQLVPEIARTLTAGSSKPGVNAPGRRREDDENLVAFAQNQRDEVRLMDKVGALAAESGAKQQTYILKGAAIGRKPEAGPQFGEVLDDGSTYTLNATEVHAVSKDMVVRRLTPLECERLQGFPDGYTDIPGASDTARYKALGNSMAVPVMRWIGERLQTLHDRTTRRTS